MGLKDAKHAVIPVADNNSDLKEDTACQNYYDRADDFIWDSIYVHFDIYVFIYQFILHLFLPLSIWMSPEPRAQMLWFDRKASPNEKFTIFTLGCFNTMTLVSLVIYEFLPDSDYHHFFGAIAYPLIFNVMWKLSVAIKYAMYSPTEYQRILTFKSWESTQNYLDQTLINRNLLSEQNDHVNRFEIAAGGHRCGVNNIHTVHFQIQNPAASAEATRQLADWHDFLTTTTPVLTKTSSKHQVNNTGLDTSKHGTDGDDGLHFDLHKQPNGSYKISLFDLCRHLQQYSQQEAIHEIGKIVEIPANCAIILVALIPYFSLIDGSYKVPLNSTLTIVFLAFTTFDCISFLFIIVSRFMNGAIIDYRRQFIMQRAFNDFIRLSDYDGLMNLSINHPFKTSNKKRDDISQRETMARFMDTHALEDFHTMRKKESMKRLRRTSLQGEVLLGGVKDVELGVGVEVGGMGSDEHKQTNRPVSLPPLDPFGARARHDHGHGHGRHRPSIALSAMSESQKRAWDGEEHIKDPDMRDPAAHVRSFPRICMDFERNIFSWVQARQIMSTFKVRFRRRIEAVAAVVMLFTMAMVGACFVVIYRSENTVAAFSTPLVLQTIVVVTVFGATLIKYTSEAANINAMYENHLMTIRAHQVVLRAFIVGTIRSAVCPVQASPVEHAAAMKAAELDGTQRYDGLEACANYVESSNRFQPCEVFGVRADMRLAGTVFSGLLTFYVTLVSVFYSSGGMKKAA